MPRHSFAIERHSEVDSTNAVALRAMQSLSAGPFPRRAWVADAQMGGRGQQGRTWSAAPGEALLMSLVWHFRTDQPLYGLSLAVGVIAEQALTSLPGIASAMIGLKWPNDLLIDGERKLGGILIETLPHPTGRIAVIGIGINLHSAPLLPATGTQAGPPSLVPACLDDIAQTPVSRDAVLEALLASCEAELPQFAAHGFVAFRARWQQRHSLQRRPVVARLPDGRQLHGVVRDVADNGALQLATDDGLHTLVSGEVSLRAART
ncbi:MAG: biotin--[acetyl-CoA-carboxylase] ligase [Burkholderiales bacterium]|nr:biotin--[acetyl-CoA-carboxylase] ligase [Burkholderiales bacterium]